MVIVSEARLPVGSFGGGLRDIFAADMDAMVVKEVMKHVGIKPSDIDETIAGRVGQIAGCSFVVRAVNLRAGLPESTYAYFVSRQCDSGLQAIADTVMEVWTGLTDVVAATSTENISQLPYCVKDARWDARMGHKVSEDGVIGILAWPLGPYHNDMTAENVAKKYNITRQEQDQYTLGSHLRAAAVIEAGKFKDEVLPVGLKDKKGNITIFDTNEGPRASQTIEKLERLEPCFVKGRTVTAGNSSSLNNDAATVVVMSREETNALDVRPLLTAKGYTVAGNDGAVMGYALKLSSEKLAAKLGLDLEAIDMFEINEAFVSQAFTVRRDLGLYPDKINIYDEGISISHPVGTTGVILAVKVLYKLQWTSKRDAMISICIGSGQGISMYFTKD